jgi:manganese oxidase
MNFRAGTYRGRHLGPGRGLGAAAVLAVLLICLGVTPFTGGFPIGLPICAPGATAAKAAPVTPPRVEANRNLSPAGELQDGVLTLDLEIREGEWYPEAETGPKVVVQAFAEAGQPPQIPGPLIRVPAGTDVHATLRNALEKPARVYGLHQRPSDTKDPIDVPPGETRELRFTLTTPGTYDYGATTTGPSLAGRFGVDSQLSGALIVDSPGEPVADRVFVMGILLKPGTQGDPQQKTEQFAVINGKSWPYTERLTYQIGQPVRWRLINASFFDHPMHLHGAYFRVTSEGDGEVDKALPVEKQRLVVTDRMLIGETRSIEPVLEHEGRWLFHCHLLVHMSAEYRLMEPLPPGSNLPALGMYHTTSDSMGMAGLVLGITVMSGTNPAPPPTSTKPPRKLTLFVRERPASERFPAADVFQVQEGPQPPPIEAATVPGPPIVLTQGDPVEITVVNQMREATAVHWHGIELDSYYDGVPGWDGVGDKVAPPIEPGQSFVARFAPPRAGTFIYHTHWHDFRQLIGGLYGPLIVLPPGQKFDPETDKTVAIGLGGVDDQKSPMLLNGSAQPEPLLLKAGIKYRLRIFNMTPNNGGLQLSLLARGSPVRWRAVAKDGADLPPAQAIEKEARQVVSVGETYDFEFQPTAKDDLRLELLRPFNRSWAVEEVQVR